MAKIAGPGFLRLSSISRHACIGKGAAARFSSDDRGVVAMVFAFVSLAMFLFAGLGIDMARILAARSALIEASDAAALTVGRALVDGVAIDVAKERGEANFSANIKGVERAGATSPMPTINADPVAQIVTINASVAVPLTLLRLTGRDEVIVPVRSEIRYDLKDLEIGVAIDVTGSMGRIGEWHRKNGRYEAGIQQLHRPSPSVVTAVWPQGSRRRRAILCCRQPRRLRKGRVER